jgi:hypothetical protein
MKIQQLQYSGKAWKILMHPDGFDRMQCQLVLAFGEASIITETSVFNHLERSYPEAHIILCVSAGGEMHHHNSVVVTAIEFVNTSITCAETNITEHRSSQQAGKYLKQQLKQKDLQSVFIISDSKGNELVDGFNGGRSGKGTRFIRRMAGLNGLPAEGTVVAVVFEGDESAVFQMQQYLGTETVAFNR